MTLAIYTDATDGMKTPPQPRWRAHSVKSTVALATVVITLIVSLKVLLLYRKPFA